MALSLSFLGSNIFQFAANAMCLKIFDGGQPASYGRNLSADALRYE